MPEESPVNPLVQSGLEVPARGAVVRSDQRQPEEPGREVSDDVCVIDMSVENGGPKVLRDSVNCLGLAEVAPISGWYGDNGDAAGATLVDERMGRRFHERDDAVVIACTTAFTRQGQDHRLSAAERCWGDQMDYTLWSASLVAVGSVNRSPRGR